jgi:hypothetical protein
MADLKTIFGLSDRVAMVTGASSGPGAEAAADLRRGDELRAALDRIEEALGQVGIVVNAAGVAPLGRAERHERDKWDEAIALNLSAAFDLSQLGGARMIERGSGGRIIHATSVMWDPWETGCTEPWATPPPRAGSTISARGGTTEQIRGTCLCTLSWRCGSGRRPALYFASPPHRPPLQCRFASRMRLLESGGGDCQARPCSLRATTDS